MKPLPEWIITRVDGKIAAVSTDYRLFAAVAEKIARLPAEKTGSVTCTKTSTADLFRLSETVTADDLVLFGSKFQNMVGSRLFSLTHPAKGEGAWAEGDGFPA